MFDLKRTIHSQGYGVTDLPSEYIDKVVAAETMFIEEPDVYLMPRYYIFVGATRYNAIVYGGDSSEVIFTEELVKDYTVTELSGVIAHELAHAEWHADHPGELDDRDHYLVDLRAVDLVGRGPVLKMLTRMKEEAESYFARNRIWYYLYFFKLQDHQEAMDKLEKRIKEVREYSP